MLNLSWWKSQRVLLNYFFFSWRIGDRLWLRGVPHPVSCLSTDHADEGRCTVGEVEGAAREDLTVLERWLRNNKLQLKTDKTQSMVCTLGPSHLLNWDCKLYVWKNFRELATRGEVHQHKNFINIPQVLPVRDSTFFSNGLETFQSSATELETLARSFTRIVEERLLQKMYYSVKEFYKVTSGCVRACTPIFLPAI